MKLIWYTSTFYLYQSALPWKITKVFISIIVLWNIFTCEDSSKQSVHHNDNFKIEKYFFIKLRIVHFCMKNLLKLLTAS